MRTRLDPAGRLALALLSALLAALPLLSAPAAAQEPRVALEAKWLVLRKDDINGPMVQASVRTSDEARASRMTVRFDPDYKGREDDPPTPLLVIDTLWTASDIAAAQQIYQEQIGAGFPDAPVPVHNVGSVSLPPLGDEAQGIGGCGDCDESQVHHRIVFRYLNVVHALYVYGHQDYAYLGVAVNWANILNERVRAMPTGPSPDVMKSVFPREVALTVGELGKQIDVVQEAEGGDERAQWVEGRFHRANELASAKIGPLKYYDKVWVAKSIDLAQQIFDEQAQPGFPEARDPVGTDFEMENRPGVGSQTFGWSACNETCNTEKFNRLHHRLVWRTGNVVVVLYTWGGDDQSTVAHIGYVAGQMNSRIK